MQRIIEALFDGQIIPWERRADVTAEHRAVNKKIEDEKRYFMEKMSLDDCKRFQKLESLYETAVHCEDVDLYAHGFTLGTLLMLEVLEKKESLLNG
ncbi:DUF6809 family protein [Anaeromassilibacillus senegalensis]|uniref:DUF6809 family protein n=1 Tax=Anaeromassilibacillus senegalensis TaxID=1673717 RepID=UPI000681125D|nr:DUF6809 family protein [Anaeromassilibacillus senegalensis]